MRRLAAIEGALERLFERSSARVFGLRLQPVQVLRRVERAMEEARRGQAGRTVVPDALEVHLNPADLAAFGDLGSTLALELADGALAFARIHRYALGDRPTVVLKADERVAGGEVAVTATFSVSAGEVAGSSAHTSVYQAPSIDSPVAMLRVIGPDGSSREVPVDGHRLTIGRASDNGLVLGDSRVSRHHARISVRQRALVLVDLGSTNGSRVNGVRVSEVALGEGDRIELGDTVVLVERVADDPDGGPSASDGEDPAAGRHG